MALDLASDHLLIDNLESVEYTTVVSGTQTIDNVYRLEKNTSEKEPAEGSYEELKVDFQLPAPFVPELKPGLGDALQALDPTDGTTVTYTVQSVREPFLNDYWGVSTTKVLITNHLLLQDLITLYPAVVTTDSYGSRRTIHPDAAAGFTDVESKIQLMPSPIEDRTGKRSFVRKYDIYIDKALPDGTLAVHDIIKDVSLNVYTIKSWRSRQRIDELSVIECEATAT